MVNAFPLIMPCDLRALQHNMDPNKDVKNLSRWNVISWIMCIELDKCVVQACGGSHREFTRTNWVIQVIMRNLNCNLTGSFEV